MFYIILYHINNTFKTTAEDSVGYDVTRNVVNFMAHSPRIIPGAAYSYDFDDDILFALRDHTAMYSQYSEGFNSNVNKKLYYIGYT